LTPTEKAAWASRRTSLRKRITRILRGLREDGEIDSLDLDRLHNYCMVMLMVLSKVSPGTLDAAIKEAEIAALLLGQVEDFEVVMDKDLSRRGA
jgi:hypothetical protein